MATGTLSVVGQSVTLAGTATTAGSLVTVSGTFTGVTLAFTCSALNNTSLTGPAVAVSETGGGSATIWKLTDNTPAVFGLGSIQSGSNVTVTLTAIASGSVVVTVLATGIVTAQAITQAATVTPNLSLGSLATITVTTNANITVANPALNVSGGEFDLVVFNNSGGAMGTVSFGNLYLVAGGAFTSPGSGKRRSVRFRFDGTYWVELSRSAADT